MFKVGDKVIIIDTGFPSGIIKRIEDGSATVEFNTCERYAPLSATGSLSCLRHISIWEEMKERLNV